MGGCPRWEMVIVYNNEASKDKEKIVHIQYILGGKLGRSSDGFNIGNEERKPSRLMPKFLVRGTAWIVEPFPERENPGRESCWAEERLSWGVICGFQVKLSARQCDSYVSKSEVRPVSKTDL